MNNSMTIEELGKEYEKNSSMQEFFISKCKESIKIATRKGDQETVRQLKSDLYKLYEIKRELDETARKLINYYK